MILKLYFNNSTRRVEFADKEEDGVFLRLTEFLERTFQLHLGFSVKYRDDEGDLCNITGDLALRAALSLYPKVLKLNIDANLDDDDFGFVLVNEPPPENWEVLHGDDLDQVDSLRLLSLSPSSVIPQTQVSPSASLVAQLSQAAVIHTPTSPDSIQTSAASKNSVSNPETITPQTIPTIIIPLASQSSLSKPITPIVQTTPIPSPQPVTPGAVKSEGQNIAIDVKTPAPPTLCPIPADLDAQLGFKAVAVDRILWQYGRYRVKISGDGDCAFASVAQQLAASGGGSFTVNDLRQIFCDEIASNFSQWNLYFPGSSMAEINKFRSKGHWDSDLGDAVIIVLCLMFQVDCTIYRHDRRVVHSWSPNAPGKSPMLHLAHHCAHFDATRPISTLSPKPVLVA